MIKIMNLNKKFDDTIIFKDTNMVLPDKGLVCILGPSGSGKSTLLNILAGFDTDYQGSIEINNTKMEKLSHDELVDYRRNNVGFIFQSYNLIPGYTSLENVKIASDIKEGEGDTDEAIVTLFKKLNIESKQDQNTSTLSGGEKQRVAIARALINNPTIILADEPTGALDRQHSNEIMSLLREISETQLVLVITHDKKCAEYAEEVITIQDYKLISNTIRKENETKRELNLKQGKEIDLKHRSVANFKLRTKRYMAIGIAIAIGVVCFAFSLSTRNIIDNSINDFKLKNNTYQNGFIKLQENEEKIHKRLKNDDRISDVYYQYIINDIKLVDDKNDIIIPEKYPVSKATQQMSYGRMPDNNGKEIVLNPSLASKLSKNIEELVGKNITLEYKNEKILLTISGIFNATFDDFMVSSEIEKELYKTIKDQPYSISYEVDNFEDVPLVSHDLENNGINSENASQEVEAFLTTFENIEKLFIIISVLILGVAIFISSMLITRQQNTRYREVGLLSALGYTRNQIKDILFDEAKLLSLLIAFVTFVLFIIVALVTNIFGVDFELRVLQVFLSLILAIVIVSTIMLFSNKKLTNIEPSDALRR